MKSLKFVFMVVLCILISIVGCDKSTTGSEVDDELANAYAQEGFNLLNQTILDIEEIPEDPQSGDDIFPELVYDEIKSLFEQALEVNPENAMANLGMGILEIASVNYDEELWDLISDFDDEFGDTRIFNGQFSLLMKIPRWYMIYLNNSLRDDTISLARIQNYIDSNVLPKLNTSLIHLDYAINLSDDNPIIINTGEELVELDNGEIYVFRASLYSVMAAMKMATLYDMDMFDENGTYDWINELSFEDDGDVAYYNYNSGTQTLYLEYHFDGYVAAESLGFHILKYNLENRPEFLQYRTGNTPASIQDDLENLLTDLQNAVDYISNEGDNQDDDIIKFEYIVEFNEEIGGINPGGPNFTQGWETIDDIIDWAQQLLDGEYTFEEDDVTITVNLSASFNPGLQDLKDYFPYHQWLPEDEWVNCELDWEYEWYNGGGSYGFWFEDDWVVIENVEYVHESYYDYWFDPVEFLDGPGGNVIDPDDEFLYFPDYTLNGLFPYMTREDWEDILFGG